MSKPKTLGGGTAGERVSAKPSSGRSSMREFVIAASIGESNVYLLHVFTPSSSSSSCTIVEGLYRNSAMY